MLKERVGMSKKIVLKVLLSMCLLSTLFLTQFNTFVKASSPIIVDGDPSDWAGITPIISDLSGDTPYGVADVKDVYMTWDATNLYVRIDVYGNISATAGDYNVDLDTDMNATTGADWWADIGTDYRLNVYAGKSFLRKWTGLPFPENWETTIVDLPEAYSGSILETSVPLSAINFSGEMDVVVGCSPIDVAPQDTYINYTVGTHVAPIVVDGIPDDWVGIAKIFTDSAGDAANASMDITDCYVANDVDGYIYIRMDISGVMDPLLDCFGYLDADQDPNTGWLYPWGVGVDDVAEAYDVGGTILEAKSYSSYPNDTGVNLFFLAYAEEEYADWVPNTSHVWIPEFPPTMIVPLLMTATLIAVILSKTVWSRTASKQKLERHKILFSVVEELIFYR